MLPHEKIIKATAKRILEPEKLFQVGFRVIKRGEEMVLIGFYIAD